MPDERNIEFDIKRSIVNRVVLNAALTFRSKESHWKSSQDFRGTMLSRRKSSTNAREILAANAPIKIVLLGKKGVGKSGKFYFSWYQP